MSKRCIIYCIEQGKLEHLTLLSIASIRRYGGELNRFDIFCIQPRSAFRISRFTRNKLDELNVKFIDKNLNKRYKFYALANKPIACAYVMENFSYDQYLFLDGDTIVLNDPTGFFSSDDDVMLSPVNFKGVGIIDLGDPNGAYWKELFNLACVETETIPKLKTVAKKEEILSYWNSGVILFNGNHGICHEWKNLLGQVLSKKIYPIGGIFFVEQTCLTAAILGGDYTVANLPINCNFPILRNGSVDCGEHKSIAVVHHYHNMDLLEKRLSMLVDADKMRWIQSSMKGLDEISGSFFERVYIGFIEWRNLLMARIHYMIYKYLS